MLKNIAKIFIEMLKNAQLEVMLDLYGYTSVLYLRRMKGATLLVWFVINVFQVCIPMLFVPLLLVSICKVYSTSHAIHKMQSSGV